MKQCCFQLMDALVTDHNGLSPQQLASATIVLYQVRYSLAPEKGSVLKICLAMYPVVHTGTMHFSQCTWCCLSFKCNNIILSKKWASVQRLDVAWEHVVTGCFGPELKLVQKRVALSMHGLVGSKETSKGGNCEVRQVLRMQNLLMVLQAELGEVDWIRFGMERSSHVQQAVPN